MKSIIDIINQMSYHLKEFGRNTMAIFRDSKSYNTTNSNWLQGRLMNVLTGRIVSCYNKQSVYVDELGKWAAFQLKIKEKTIVVIMIYRIPNSSDQGVYKAITQYNKMRR